MIQMFCLLKICLKYFLVKFRFRTAVVALSTCQAFGGTLQIRKILSKPSSAKWRLKLEVILPCIVVEPSTYTEQKNITRDSLKRTANFEKWSVKKSHFDLLYIKICISYNLVHVRCMLCICEIFVYYCMNDITESRKQFIGCCKYLAFVTI